MKAETKLIQKGYKFLDASQDPEQAKEIAKQYRANGYYARVLKQGTNVIGLYEYAIFIKLKQK